MQVFPTWWGRGQFDSAKSSLHHQEMRGWGQFQPCRCWYSSSTRLETTPPSIFNKTWRKTKFQNYFWQSSFKFYFYELHCVDCNHPQLTGGAGFTRVGVVSAGITTLAQSYYPCYKNSKLMLSNFILAPVTEKGHRYLSWWNSFN